MGEGQGGAMETSATTGETADGSTTISAEMMRRTAQLEQTFARYRDAFGEELRATLARAQAESSTPPNAAPAGAAPLLDELYGQMEYHLGWRAADLSPARANPGKLLRPTLLLLCCELVAGRYGADAAERAALVRRALPAAVSVELVHNFSLIHDDIEDGDQERRRRPTLWRVWGVPQAINTGDGMFSLARLELWRLIERGVAPEVAARLAARLDRTCLDLCEGQHLDMRFERRRGVTVAMYLAMIERKTAALMACAAEMGARLGAPAGATNGEGAGALGARLNAFGRALGVAFQLRDDLLGVWASEAALGKTEAGDLRRKKMSLPALTALERAGDADRATLLAIYEREGEASDAEVETLLAILNRAGAQEQARAAIRERSQAAREALAAVADDAPQTEEPRRLLEALVDFVLVEHA